LETKSMYLYKTEANEEGFAIDTSNINFNNKTLLTSFNKKNKTYSLIKIW